MYYIDPDAYDIVVLSVDNWQEYFEWTEAFYHVTNAFGEVSSVGTEYYFSLKEEYYDRFSAFQISRGDAELSYTSQEHRVSVNVDGKSYTKGEHNYKEGYQYTDIHKLDTVNNASKSYFGKCYTSASVREGSHNDTSVLVCDYVISHSVTRIQGTLYLSKNN